MALLSAEEIANLRADVENTHLDMLCTIQRMSASSVDPSGHEIQEWNNHLVDEPCHYWQTDEVEQVAPNNFIASRKKLLLRVNIDVANGDRVLQIIGVDGTQVEGVLDIESVNKHWMHTLLGLEEIT